MFVCSSAGSLFARQVEAFPLRNAVVWGGSAQGSLSHDLPSDSSDHGDHISTVLISAPETGIAGPNIQAWFLDSEIIRVEHGRTAFCS